MRLQEEKPWLTSEVKSLTLEFMNKPLMVLLLFMAVAVANAFGLLIQQSVMNCLKLNLKKC